jgi:hypothetical protein
MVAFCILGSAFAQNKAIDFRKGMPFSEGYVAGNIKSHHQHRYQIYCFFKVQTMFS